MIKITKPMSIYQSGVLDADDATVCIGRILKYDSKILLISNLCHLLQLSRMFVEYLLMCLSMFYFYEP